MQAVYGQTLHSNCKVITRDIIIELDKLIQLDFLENNENLGEHFSSFETYLHVQLIHFFLRKSPPPEAR